MNNNRSLILCALLVGGCADYEDDGLPEDLAAGETESEDEGDAMGEPVEEPDDSEDPDAGFDPLDGEIAGDNWSEVANSDPLLKWVLYTNGGQAKFIGVDPTTGLASTVNASSDFGTTWTPIGIAGNKVLWQHHTGTLLIWTIDPTTGAYVSSQAHTVPSGWIAEGITLDQEGQCPPAAESARSYTVLFKRPTTWYTPSPALWHLDQNLSHVSTEYLPDQYWGTADLRDFRYSPQGYAALIYKNPFAFGGHGDNVIDWYGRDSSGNLERLRTDTYSATQGNMSCTPHKTGIPCFFDMNDAAPGAGFELTSFLTTWPVGGSATYPASYLLWSKNDGAATNMRLGYTDGKLKSPAAPIASTPGFTAVSETGTSPEFCPVTLPLGEPFEHHSMPVIDGNACEYCS